MTAAPEAPSARVLEPADYRRMPWRNGRGQTLELAREPADGEAFDWRLSMADIEADAPFSAFAGCARALLLLEGDGLRLQVAGETPRELRRPLGGHLFDAAAETGGELLGGAVRVLNVIWRPERLAVHITPLQAADGAVTLAPDTRDLLVLCLEEDIGVDLRPAARGWSLLPGECLLLRGVPQGSRLLIRDGSGEARGVLVEMRAPA